MLSVYPSRGDRELPFVPFSRGAACSRSRAADERQLYFRAPPSRSQTSTRCVDALRALSERDQRRAAAALDDVEFASIADPSAFVSKGLDDGTLLARVLAAPLDDAGPPSWPSPTDAGPTRAETYPSEARGVGPRAADAAPRGAWLGADSVQGRHRREVSSSSSDDGFVVPQGLVDVERRSNCAIDSVVAVLFRCPTFVARFGDGSGDLARSDATVSSSAPHPNVLNALDAVFAALASREAPEDVDEAIGDLRDALSSAAEADGSAGPVAHPWGN